MDKIKRVNYQFKTCIIYSLAFSLILNALTLVTNLNITVYITFIINFIPYFLGFAFLYNVYKNFTGSRLFTYIIPKNKRYIFLNLVIKWVTGYALLYIMKVFFIAMKIDMNLFLKTSDIKGLLLEQGLNFFIHIILPLIIAFLIVIKYVYKTHVVAIIFGVVILGGPIINMPIELYYQYEYKYSLETIDRYRTLEVIEDKGKNKESDVEVSISYSGTKIIMYGGIIPIMATGLVLGFIAMRNIDKFSLDEGKIRGLS